jgi:U3 small nucleolar RNA-associated protein 15
MWEPKKHETYRRVVISGSYDHTIRVWNLDMYQDKSLLGIMDHGAPVEQLLLVPSSDHNRESVPWLLSAGGTQIKVWNFLTGQCHAKLQTKHSKTITALVSMARIIDGNTKAWRILTAGLDGLLRIHTWSSDKGEISFIHGIKILDPIMSLAFNESHNTLAIGTTTGRVLFRQEGVSLEPHKRKRDPKSGTYAYFTRGMNVDARADDYVVTESKKRKLQSFELALKQFR